MVGLDLLGMHALGAIGFIHRMLEKGEHRRIPTGLDGPTPICMPGSTSGSAMGLPIVVVRFDLAVLRPPTRIELDALASHQRLCLFRTGKTRL